jgi:hypothetical protein
MGEPPSFIFIDAAPFAKGALSMAVGLTLSSVYIIITCHETVGKLHAMGTVFEGLPDVRQPKWDHPTLAFPKTRNFME